MFLNCLFSEGLNNQEMNLNKNFPYDKLVHVT